MSKPKNSKDALEFIHTLDSLAIKKQKEEIERLKAEVELIYSLDPMIREAVASAKLAREGRRP